MKTRTKLLTIGLGAIAALNFASCQDYTEFTEDQIRLESKQREFAKNFIKEFGEPDPNHTWGWEGMTPELADAILGENGTRAAYNPGHDTSGDPYPFTPGSGNQEGRILVNHNQWAEWDSQTNDYKSYSIARMVHIPGWPNEAGEYIANGSVTEHNGKYYGTPKGDISEYEIQYVSWWMRNHPYDPGSSEQSHLDLVDLHVSEFFIQQVSHDADYSDYTNLATTERDLHEVEGGGWAMDYLHFKALDGNWTHINNFNASQNSKPWNNLGNNNTRTIQYVMSSGTEDFNYHSTTSTGGYTFDKWVMVKIDWDEPLDEINWSQYDTQEKLETYLASTKTGNTVHREGYYLCFDFQADKDNGVQGMDYPGDNHFSNWILKITPGKQKQIDRWPKRLMCEDLGNTYDFDFNDAVFDLFFQENTSISGSYDCIVTLQAAGGTMPIWVAINPNDLPAGYSREAAEIHKLLGGYPATTPVNVIKDGGAKAPFASYRVKDMFKITDPQPMYVKDSDGNWVANTSYDQTELLMTKMAAAAFTLSIYVQQRDGSVRHVSGYDIYKSLRNPADGGPDYNQGYNNGNKATNIAPQLFNCSVDAKWTYENQHIGEAYKHFVDWVHQEQGPYRLRWDKASYYERHFDSNGNATASKVDNDISTWNGSWDFGPASSTEWGSSSKFIDKDKCWGGNGPE